MSEELLREWWVIGEEWLCAVSWKSERVDPKRYRVPPIGDRGIRLEKKGGDGEYGSGGEGQWIACNVTPHWRKSRNVSLELRVRGKVVRSPPRRSGYWSKSWKMLAGANIWVKGTRESSTQPLEGDNPQQSISCS